MPLDDHRAPIANLSEADATGGDFINLRAIGAFVIESGERRVRG